MLQIRKAQAQDIDAIAKLMFLAMEEIVYFFLDTTDSEKGIQFLRQHIATPGNQYSLENIIVAEKENVIQGQICVYDGAKLDILREPILKNIRQERREAIRTERETQAGETYIDSLAVAESARGKGIGKMLLLYAIDLFVKQKGLPLGLLVDKENPKAKQLYVKIGFKVKASKTIFQKEMEHLQFTI